MRIEMDKIYCGDSLQVLQTLPENAVDCCVTSPPYYALRDYGADGQIGREATPEEYVSRITAVFHEVKRVLTPEGTCWLNIADTYCGTGSKADHQDPKYPKGRNGQQVAFNHRAPGCKPKDLIGIQHQYDALAKKTLVGEAKSHRRTLAKRAAREVTFSDLSESELAQLFTTDEYESDYFRFQVSGFDVLVKNELLAEALNALPERKRDIILLSYFLDMSDAEIGELLNVVRTTVFRHRKSALAKIKQYLEGKADDEYR